MATICAKTFVIGANGHMQLPSFANSIEVMVTWKKNIVVKKLLNVSFGIYVKITIFYTVLFDVIG